MKQPFLSICIPNYNRAELLLENIRSIGKQATSEIEVVIADDCSTEDIASTIKRAKKEFPKLNLLFQINSKNLGFDKNVLHVVNQGHGKYCWLLSNDDQLMPNAIANVLQILKKDQKISLLNVNYSRFDHLLKTTTAEQMVDLKKSKLFTKTDQFFFYPTISKKSYFKYLGVNTLTMSTDIFRRDYWREVVVDNTRYIGHNFIHIFVLASVIKKYPHIYFCAAPQVQYLANNHRTWPNDIWKDLNKFFIDHLLNLGFNRKKSLEMRRRHKVYEQKEALVKNKILSVPYLKTMSQLGMIKQRLKLLLDV